MKLADFEPVRLYLAALVGPIAALLIGLGYWDANRVNLVSGVVLAILAVPTSMIIRSKVTPVAKIQVTGNIATDVINAVTNRVDDQLNRIPQAVDSQIGHALNTVVPDAISRATSAVAAISAQNLNLTVQPSPQQDPEPVTQKFTKVSRPLEVNPYA